MQFPLRSAFIALPLDGDARAQFQSLQDQLKEYEAILRFQNPTSPHLTLQFWSTLMEIEYKQVLREAAVIASKAVPFAVNVGGAETFGSRGLDRVLFLSIPFSDELARLKKRCPWPSDRPFHPHITLARIAHPDRFIRVKKRVMKLLRDTSFFMDVRLLRLYADVDGVKQTPLQDFLFEREKLSK